ncbi:MAG: hypothetical protein RI988_2531 [Pseudomonadota bacterium]|jgi:uncharacterized protein (TIGR02001 family)
MFTPRLSLAAAAAALLASTLAAPAVAADSSVVFNAGAVTDYRYRGISQSRLKPALQGGVDYTAGAFYVGAWGSTIQWIKDGGGGADVEVDIYGGYKLELAKGTVLDLGVLTYQYPSNGLKPSANTTEVYGALTFGPVTAKYSHSTTNLFGAANSKGSGYLDLSGSFEVAGITVTPHIGRQTVKNNGGLTYTDYSITLSKEIAGVVWSAALVDTDTKAYTGPGGKDLGKASLVLGAKVNF